MLEKGKYNEAEDKFKDVFVMDSKNVDAHLMLGKTMLLMGDHKNSRKTYEKLLKEIDSRNTYALCAVGNLNVHFARIDPKMVSFGERRSLWVLMGPRKRGCFI